MLTPADSVPREEIEVFDSAAVAAELATIARAHRGNERDVRNAVVQCLKGAMLEGRRTAERLLLQDRHGRRCALRLCLMHDEIIRLLYEFACRHLYPVQNPSEA